MIDVRELQALVTALYLGSVALVAIAQWLSFMNIFTDPDWLQAIAGFLQFGAAMGGLGFAYYMYRLTRDNVEPVVFMEPMGGTWERSTAYALNITNAGIDPIVGLRAEATAYRRSRTSLDRIYEEHTSPLVTVWKPVEVEGTRAFIFSSTVAVATKDWKQYKGKLTGFTYEVHLEVRYQRKWDRKPYTQATRLLLEWDDHDKAYTYSA